MDAAPGWWNRGVPEALLDITWASWTSYDNLRCTGARLRRARGRRGAASRGCCSRHRQAFHPSSPASKLLLLVSCERKSGTSALTQFGFFGIPSKQVCRFIKREVSLFFFLLFLLFEYRIIYGVTEFCSFNSMKVNLRCISKS